MIFTQKSNAKKTKINSNFFLDVCGCFFKPRVVYRINNIKFFKGQKVISNISDKHICKSQFYYIVEIKNDNISISESLNGEPIKDKDGNILWFDNKPKTNPMKTDNLPYYNLDPGFCTTVYKWQGSTIHEPYDIYNIESMTFNEVYTALSRATKLDDINFNSTISFNKAKRLIYHYYVSKSELLYIEKNYIKYYYDQNKTLVNTQGMPTEFIKYNMKNDEVEEKAQKLLDNSVREKYHINVCKNGVVLLTWTDLDTGKQLKKEFRSAKIGVENAIQKAEAEKSKLIELDNQKFSIF